MKLLSILLITTFALSSCVVTQRADGTFMLNNEYSLDFSDQVTIKIGGATKSQSTSDWQNGSTVGNHTISGETFEQLQAATSDRYSFKIKSTGLNNVHEIIAKNLKTGKSMKGSYNYNSKTFSFVTAQGSSGSNNSGSMEVGILKGKFNGDFSAISDGELQMGWIAAMSPVIISADATFYYSAKKN